MPPHKNQRNRWKYKVSWHKINRTFGYVKFRGARPIFAHSRESGEVFCAVVCDVAPIRRGVVLGAKKQGKSLIFAKYLLIHINQITRYIEFRDIKPFFAHCRESGEQIRAVVCDVTPSRRGVVLCTKCLQNHSFSALFFAYFPYICIGPFRLGVLCTNLVESR